MPGYLVHGDWDGLRVEYWRDEDALRFIDPATSKAVVDMPVSSFCELALKVLDREFETFAMCQSLRRRGYHVEKRP